MLKVLPTWQIFFSTFYKLGIGTVQKRGHRLLTTAYPGRTGIFCTVHCILASVTQASNFDGIFVPER